MFGFTPKGRVITLPVGSRRSIAVRRAHRGRPRVHRGQGQRSAGVARPARCRAVPRARSRRRVESPALAGLAGLRQVATGPQQDPPEWFSRERHLDMIEAGQRELAAELRREGLPVSGRGSDQARRRSSRLRLHRPQHPPGGGRRRHHVSAWSVAERTPAASAATTTRSSGRRRAARTPATAPGPTRSGVARRGSRRRARRLRRLHAGHGRRDDRLRHPRCGASGVHRPADCATSAAAETLTPPA